jgi:hypothetical protein
LTPTEVCAKAPTVPPASKTAAMADVIDERSFLVFIDYWFFRSIDALAALSGFG